MKTIRILLVLALAATASASEPFRFEPPAPTSATSVLLRVDTTWRDSCLPQSPVVTRNGANVDVLWSIPLGFGCLPAIWPWDTAVPLGMFEPGTYQVTLRVSDINREITLGTRTLVVAEFSPALQIMPPFASTRGGTEVVIQGSGFELCSATTGVEINGSPVASRRTGCTIIATLPAHAAGPVDVTVIAGGVKRTIRSTLRYVDPGAAPDPAVFERVLVPTLFSGPGAFGSQWVTEARLTNTSEFALPWFSDVAKPAACTAPCEVAPDTSMSLTAFGNHANGRILFIPRALADDVQFGGIVRDVSREEGYWGAELPFAREEDFRTGSIILPNVPVDPRYRVQLRIYGIDGVSQLAGVSISKNDELLTSRIVPLSGPCNALPCNSAEPAYASVDISAMVPPGTTGPVTVIVYRPSSTPSPTWALVSITNNTTQNVTTIRPQY